MAQSGKILITGAAGFVGTALCRHLYYQGSALRVLVRRDGTPLPEDLLDCLDDVVGVEDFLDETSWENLLVGVDRVVHLAARAHAGGRQSQAADLYFCDNLDVTVSLARAVLKSEVKKFIFISSIKVNGEGVLKPDHDPYKVSDRPRPEGAYAISKWRAEQELDNLFRRDGAPELVILRPPMIYGDAVKGNSAYLQKWLSWSLPLPVSGAGNRRSLLALERLLKILTDILSDTVKPSRLFLPCDTEDLSTEQLAEHFAQKVGCRVRTLAIPGFLLYGLSHTINCENFLIKLFGSLRIEKNKKLLRLYQD